METVLSFDLGTGGVKACLFNAQGKAIAYAFEEYSTYYQRRLFQEQKPEDWWKAVCLSAGKLKQKMPVEYMNVSAIGVSGHSLGVVAMDRTGNLVFPETPIWSDGRSEKQAEDFFRTVDYNEWYLQTGAGFPANLYSAFKIRWYKDEYPDLHNKTTVFFGSKDYINFRLTGSVCTDFSYASGNGVYHLKKHAYEKEWIRTLEIDEDKLPRITPSSEVIGTVHEEAAAQLNLKSGVPVVCGGVDNACMALGAACFRDGKVYTSLGSSAWVAVSDGKPIVDTKTKPYVFEHCVPGQYVSSTCIFSAGNSFRWIRDTLCADIKRRAEETGNDAYDLMTELARQSKPGANALIFNPSLSGGSSLDASADLRGSFTGLDLRHTLGDVIRASMEGISMNLRLAMDVLGSKTKLTDEMLLVGGGTKSRLWRQIFADIYEKTILETTVGQDAGALGAAALALKGVGIQDSYDFLCAAHVEKSRTVPDPDSIMIYRAEMPIFQKIADSNSELGVMMAKWEKEK